MKKSNTHVLLMDLPSGDVRIEFRGPPVNLITEMVESLIGQEREKESPQLTLLPQAPKSAPPFDPFDRADQGEGADELVRRLQTIPREVGFVTLTQLVDLMGWRNHEEAGDIRRRIANSWVGGAIRRGALKRQEGRAGVYRITLHRKPPQETGCANCGTALSPEDLAQDACPHCGVA